MNTLKNALLRVFGCEIEEGDTITLEHNYCGHNIVDVVVTDHRTGESYTFPAFDISIGGFPYENDED